MPAITNRATTTTGTTTATAVFPAVESPPLPFPLLLVPSWSAVGVVEVVLLDDVVLDPCVTRVVGVLMDVVNKVVVERVFD